MNKRERIVHLAREGRLADDYVPSAFFLHFPPEFHTGDGAVRKHLDYFRATDNDIVKIQFELHYPEIPQIAASNDWSSHPIYDESFYIDQLDVVEGVVREVHGEAPVIVTLYSPLMFAGHTVGKQRLARLFAQDPVAVRIGLDRIVESMGYFIRGCLARGVDGFYASTQGGEDGRLPAGAFEKYVKPTDLAVWEMFTGRCELTVLHVCDFEAPYASFDSFLDYPGDIVSAPNEVGGAPITGAEVARLFGRPFLGGMERLGAISTGPEEAVVAGARAALESGPDAMILGADCTLDASTDWTRIAAATAVAHGWRS